MKQRVLPFDYIEKNSKVILYGAGNNGKLFWEQNQLLNWCDICMVVDSNFENTNGFPIEVVSPNKIMDVKEYDYILVSVLNPAIKKEIVEFLIHMGVNSKKIIDRIDSFFYRDEEMVIMDYEKSSVKEGKLQVAFYPGGVMGDNVISLRLYQEIIKIVPKCEMDVFTYFSGFPEIVFGRQKNLRKIIHRVPNESDKENYDVIIQSHFEPSLLYCNVERTKCLAPNLLDALLKLYNYQITDWFMCNPAQYMNRLQWDRAKFKGWNCYTILGSSGAFDIQDSVIEFNVNAKYEEDFLRLELMKPYITFNFGASDPLKDGKRQTKMWPYEYHCELNKLLKKHYPNIQLVQIGASDVTCVPGADRYILGEHLEVTKYVLKNAICHFDCEGGLVHIATQLGTKCFVVFGPTPVSFFGYEQNVNIVSKECKECCGLIKEWYTKCYKYEEARCMSSIKPNDVFVKIDSFLREIVY